MAKDPTKRPDAPEEIEDERLDEVQGGGRTLSARKTDASDAAANATVVETKFSIHRALP